MVIGDLQTTLIGGGTGPTASTKATTCTPSQTYLKTMMRATDTVALNFAFTGKGNDSGKQGLREQIKFGCAGLKLHEVSFREVRGRFRRKLVLFFLFFLLFETLTRSFFFSNLGSLTNRIGVLHLLRSMQLWKSQMNTIFKRTSIQTL